MVYFMLDNLRCKAFECTGSLPEGLILIFHRDPLITFRLSDPGKRQTAFFRLELSCSGDDLWINHDHLHRPITENDDTLPYSDHIRRHAHTAVEISPQRIQQIHNDLFVCFSCRFGFYRKEQRVMDDLPVHFAFLQYHHCLSHCFDRTELTIN